MKRAKQMHISQLKGIVKTKRKKSVSLAEMKKVISEVASGSKKRKS